jgi:hypothetical protein
MKLYIIRLQYNVNFIGELQYEKQGLLRVTITKIPEIPVGGITYIRCSGEHCFYRRNAMKLIREQGNQEFLAYGSKSRGNLTA